MNISNGVLTGKLKAMGYKIIEPLLKDAKLFNALNADNQEIQDPQLKGATLADALDANGQEIQDGKFKGASLVDALLGNGKDAKNLNAVEIGRVGTGTTKPATQDTFEIQVDTDTGTNGEAYLVWNDGGTKRTISLGTT